jgi:hypothetical protein
MRYCALSFLQLQSYPTVSICSHSSRTMDPSLSQLAPHATPQRASNEPTIRRPKRKRKKSSAACLACQKRKSRCEVFSAAGCHRCRVLGTECSLTRHGSRLERSYQPASDGRRYHKVPKSRDGRGRFVTQSHPFPRAPRINAKPQAHDPPGRQQNGSCRKALGSGSEPPTVLGSEKQLASQQRWR